MLTDLRGFVTYWNPAAERLFGLPPAEMLGSGRWPAYPDDVRQALADRQQDAHSADSPELIQAECELPAGSGRTVWVSLQVQPYFDAEGRTLGYVEICHELAWWKRQPAAGQLLGEVVNSMDSIAVAGVDQNQVFWYMNPAAERMFGWDPGAWRGQSLNLSPGLAQVFAEMNLPPRPDRTEVIRRKTVGIDLGDRKNVALDVRGMTVRSPDNTFFAVVIEPGADPEKDIFQAQKTQAIGALASGVAHDFNNILTAILSHLDLITFAPEMPDKLQQHAVYAQTSARRGAELVSKLLAFSRHSEPNLAQVQLAQIVDEVVVMLRRSIDPRIQITVTAAPSVWTTCADTNQIMQVLMNLCLNSRDAMPDGGHLSIALENVTVPDRDLQPPKHPGQFVRLTVHDTGEGMPPEILDRLFEPYFTTKSAGKGTGLGLSIAYSVISKHRGWIEVESEPGKGTLFHVFLPRAPHDEPRQETADDVPAANNKELEGTERILIVDDDELVRLVMRAVLSYRGYRVTEAVDGKEAVEKYGAADGNHDLVLLDIHMPRMNGWDALSEIRASDPGALVILLSGGIPDQNQERARTLGAATFFSKPFANQDLLRLVRRTLDGASAGSTGGPMPAVDQE